MRPQRANHAALLALTLAVIANPLTAAAQQKDETQNEPIGTSSRRLVNPRDLPAGVICEGVTTFAAPGVPGPLVVFGPDANPVAVAALERGITAPVIAAATLGKGRVVAFGHTGYLDAAAMATGDTARLIENAIRWVAADRQGEDPKPRIGIIDGDLLQFLTNRGYHAQDISPATLTKDASHYDVVLCRPSRMSDEEIRALREFAANGGGLLVAHLGWGWLQLNPGRAISEHPANRLLHETGIAWADGTLERNHDAGFVLTPSATEHHAALALDLLTAAELSPSNAEKADDKTKTAHRIAARMVELAAVTLPTDDRVIRPRLRELLATRGNALVPEEKKPLDEKQLLERVLLSAQVHEIRNAAPRECKAHPAAAIFPGAPTADAPRIRRSIKLTPSVAAWHSTGLYAAPGEVIRIRAAQAAIDNKLEIRIGAHSDALWHHSALRRVPEITRVVQIRERELEVANAFGGLIYVVVPNAINKPVELEITIDNAVEVAWFQLGRTTDEEWKTLRAAPAPWAELAGRNIIVSVPATEIRSLENPSELMRFWDEIADAAADLCAMPRERARPERYVADVQISAGYMHAGYPIMTHLDAAPDMVSVANLRKSRWGLFHELGHNHQSPDWTFEGTGEVTVNLFSLYLSEELCKQTPAAAHSALGERDKRMAAYFAKPASFDRWHSDPFLAFYMYWQMREAFGWDAYKRVFAEYRGLSSEQRPKSEQEKRDQWLVRMSRTVGRDLGPFFTAWGVPTSDAARTAIADLPDWMPEGFPPRAAHQP
ncbi:MAG: hypothetical protein JNG88_12745 [Phycisphaerales bacterium]|nr:hypothetical protein [Phycisphaerales bacterium]